MVVFVRDGTKRHTCRVTRVDFETSARRLLYRMFRRYEKQNINHLFRYNDVKCSSNSQIKFKLSNKKKNRVSGKKLFNPIKTFFVTTDIYVLMFLQYFFLPDDKTFSIHVW